MFPEQLKRGEGTGETVAADAEAVPSWQHTDGLVPSENLPPSPTLTALPLCFRRKAVQ